MKNDGVLYMAGRDGLDDDQRLIADRRKRIIEVGEMALTHAGR